jgi:hypothetical protein
MKERAAQGSADEEVVVVEDDRRVLRDGTVEVRGHWVARAKGRPSYRKKHERSRPRGHR